MVKLLNYQAVLTGFLIIYATKFVIKSFNIHLNKASVSWLTVVCAIEHYAFRAPAIIFLITRIVDYQKNLKKLGLVLEYAAFIANGVMYFLL